MDLKEYFTEHWPKGRSASLDQYMYTGWSLLDEIALNETVLDVGCGTNPFKQSLQERLWGIDITDIGSDQQIAIEDYKTDEKFDVAFVLGSINFGDRDTIKKQISAVVESLKPDGRMYWRCNPGRKDHKNDHVDKINFFPWTLEDQVEFAKQFGYTIEEHYWDGRSQNRLYTKWVRG